MREYIPLNIFPLLHLQFKTITMDKISQYIFSVIYNENILLYNTLTNALVCLTKQENEEVQYLMKNLTEFQDEYPTLYKSFKESGFIIEKDFNELNYIKFRNNLQVYANNTYHITINPTLDCNLKCWYCSTEFAQAQHCGGMNKDIIDRITAHFKNVVEVQKATRIHLDWFGGEPSMYFNEVINPISSYVNKLVEDNKIGFTQHITTNATLFNFEQIKRMKALHFTSFQIPIDGNEEKHNKVKFFEDNRGSYRQVIDSINMIAETIPNVKITLRINYDLQTLKHIGDIIKDIPLKNRECIIVDFQKVWQIHGNKESESLLHEAKEYFRLNGLNSNFWAWRPGAFYRCYSDRLRHYAINYNGKIFKCTAQDYGDDKVIGELLPNGTIKWNMALLSNLFSQSTFENSRCLKCIKLPICMGPCISANHKARKNGTPLPCLGENVQYSLKDFVIEEAKKRELL